MYISCHIKSRSKEGLSSGYQNHVGDSGRAEFWADYCYVRYQIEYK